MPKRNAAAAPDPPPITDKPRRPRRSTETVRRLILQAARELFAERGYAGATTREIAQRAGTNEVLLFRHFKSKAQLFEQTVFEPCQAFMQAFSSAHPPTPMHDSMATAQEFVSGLYQVLRDNRRLIMALFAASLYEPEVNRGLGQLDALRDYFREAEQYARQEGADSSLGVATGVRFSMALVAATVLFDEWMFAGGRRPAERRLVEDLSAFIVHGFAGAPAADPQPPARPGQRKAR
jgi:AcrR family transcriptional regulator